MDEFNDFEESKPELPILHTDSDGRNSNQTNISFVKTEILDTSTNETFANVTVKNEIPEDQCSEIPHILVKNENYDNDDLQSEFAYSHIDPLKIENLGTHFISSHVKEEIGEENSEELGDGLGEEIGEELGEEIGEESTSLNKYDTGI